MGLPARALPAGGGGVPTVGGARLGARATHRPSRRPARRGLVPAVHRGRLRAALLHPVRAATGPSPTAHHHVRVRHPGQQHRPQERSRAARSGRPAVGGRPGLVLLAGVQAADRHLGVRRAIRPRGAAPGHRSHGRRPSRSTWRRCWTTTRSRPCSTAPASSPRTPPFPSTPPAAVTPGRWCDYQGGGPKPLPLEPPPMRSSLRRHSGSSAAKPPAGHLWGQSPHTPNGSARAEGGPRGRGPAPGRGWRNGAPDRPGPGRRRTAPTPGNARRASWPSGSGACPNGAGHRRRP